jgi:hypothetical protein
MLCIDEFGRESLTIRVARKLKATDVIEASASCLSRGARLVHIFSYSISSSATAIRLLACWQ